MCKPGKQNNTDAIPPPQPPVSHHGTADFGMWQPRPLPPDVTQGEPTWEKKKKTVEHGWKPLPSPTPQFDSSIDSTKPKKPPPSPPPQIPKKSPPSSPPQIDSYSDGTIARQYKKPSASDQKHARPDTTIATSPPPRSGSDLDGPSPRRGGLLKQHHLSTERPNNLQRNSISHEMEGNTRKTAELKQPPIVPQLTEKQKMEPKESLANNTHYYENLKENQE